MKHAVIQAFGEEDLDIEMTVGAILRRTRVLYGQSLEDVEVAIRVRAEQIDALESDRSDELPGRVYALGFVRSYSEYLGLDGRKMLDMYKVQQGGSARGPNLAFLVPTMDGHLPSRALVLLSLCITLFLPYLGWQVFGTFVPKDNLEIPAVPEAMRAGALNIISLNSYDGAEGTISEDVQSREIYMDVVSDSWVEIKDLVTQEVLVSRILTAGEQYYVPNDENLTITLGNAGGVVFDSGEGVMVPFGPSGKAIRNIPLDLEQMKAYVASGEKR